MIYRQCTPYSVQAGKKITPRRHVWGNCGAKSKPLGLAVVSLIPHGMALVRYFGAKTILLVLERSAATKKNMITSLLIDRKEFLELIQVPFRFCFASFQIFVIRAFFLSDLGVISHSKGCGIVIQPGTMAEFGSITFPLLSIFLEILNAHSTRAMLR